MTEAKQHLNEEEIFHKNFLNYLLGDEMIFFCNGKDKIKELKDSMLEIGISRDSTRRGLSRANNMLDRLFSFCYNFINYRMGARFC